MSALTKRFKIPCIDLQYILKVFEKIPIPKSFDIDGVLYGIFGDFTSIYHVSCISLREYENDIVPDAHVIYGSVKKVVAVITGGSKNELDTADRIIRKSVEAGIEKSRGKPASFEYSRFDIIDPLSENHGSEILFMGYEKLAKGQAVSNLTCLEQYFEKHPDDLHMFDEEQKPLKFIIPKRNKRPAVMRPKQIYEEIGKSVFGQEDAKRSLSVILYEHLLRQQDGCRGRNIPKTNALLVGPSGCGKTLIAKTMAEVAKVPFVRIDATSLVVRGYRGGMHTEHIVDLLLSSAKGHESIANRGIIFLDEIDKLASTENDWELATHHVQNELLSVIDGADFFYESDHEDYGRTKFSFKDVLFIFGGSFERKWTDVLIRDDLVSFGLIPELANRMGTIIKMEPNSADVLIQMIRPAVEEYAAILDLGKDEQYLYTELLASIIKADKSLVKMGGRCVNPLVRRFFEDRLFEL